MGTIGIRIEKRNGLFVASCKRLSIQAEALTAAEAIQKCRDSMVLCLRQALRELDNRTTAEDNARLLVDEPEDSFNYEDERDFAPPQVLPRGHVPKELRKRRKRNEYGIPE